MYLDNPDEYSLVPSATEAAPYMNISCTPLLLTVADSIHPVADESVIVVYSSAYDSPLVKYPNKNCWVEEDVAYNSTIPVNESITVYLVQTVPRLSIAEPSFLAPYANKSHIAPFRPDHSKRISTHHPDIFSIFQVAMSLSQ